MATTKAQQRAVSKYMKENYDEIKVRVIKGRRQIIKAHAEAHGESVNGFIGRAIDETMERDAGTPAEVPAVLSTLLPPDTLEAAQNGAEVTGEAVQQFITRAVVSQVKRDETSRRIGLNPFTGERITQDIKQTQEA